MASLDRLAEELQESGWERGDNMEHRAIGEQPTELSGCLLDNISDK